MAPGESILFYSDGLVEAHNSNREMFSFPRLMRLLAEKRHGVPVIDYLLSELSTFTGENWEQEDDVTLVTLRREESSSVDDSILDDLTSSAHAGNNTNDHWHTLAEWTLHSVPGNERQAMEQVAQAVKELHLPEKRLENLKTAVAEATMNAMEHGNHFQPDKPVAIQVLASQTALAVCVRDHGGTRMLSDESEIKVPDLEAKLAELQTPRGWGLFLIKNMVDEMHVKSNATHHTVELIMYLEGDGHASEKS